MWRCTGRAPDTNFSLWMRQRFETDPTILPDWSRFGLAPKRDFFCQIIRSVRTKAVSASTEVVSSLE